jgi:1-acyl-sn-glycerol-3-phosphate acyltransferase
VKSNLTPTFGPGIYSWRRYVYACQLVAQVTGRVVGGLLVTHKNIELKVRDIEPGMRYVMAGNHQSYLDPWMVLGGIPLSIWRKTGMPRAMASNRFFNNPVVANYLRSLGSFPAKEHPTDPYGLDYSEFLLDHGQSIVIFPEGHVTLHRENTARHGIQALAQMPNVRIIPVHFEWARPRWRARFEIGIGKPFDGSKMTAQEILDRVYDIPTR